jgi:hypothetical protein
MLIEALLPLVFFQGFPSLSLWGIVYSPHLQGSGVSAYLLAAPARQVTRPSWRIRDFLTVVVLPQATPSLSDSLAASVQDCLLGFLLFTANHHIWWPFAVRHLEPGQ